ncbi:MGMT family protein [Candidatus Woesearchaeota archaeon]|nr:MGMT family protein [Candidatus Woesearchaeota archaeon]
MGFNEKVYDLLKKIPERKLSTYKILAEKLNTKAYRAVGNALNKNPNAPYVPCHRIINSNGFIGGYAKGIKKKIDLLKKEGIEIKNNKIDLKKYLFKF